MFEHSFDPDIFVKYILYSVSAAVAHLLGRALTLHDACGTKTLCRYAREVPQVVRKDGSPQWVGS